MCRSLSSVQEIRALTGTADSRENSSRTLAGRSVMIEQSVGK